MTIDGLPCPHTDFMAKAEIGRILRTETDLEPAYFVADIRVHCAQCDLPFEWDGLPIGIDPDRPTVSVDGQELHAPLHPAGKPNNTEGCLRLGGRLVEPEDGD